MNYDKIMHDVPGLGDGERYLEIDCIVNNVGLMTKIEFVNLY